MKISYNESGKAAMSSGAGEAKILPEKRPRKYERAAPEAAANLSPLEHGMAVAEAALKDVPDTRDEIVNELKDRILQGEYKVSGDDIADMMLRRRAADRLR
jgi:flagellar biosynthesis anti-sigma factor FlgM